MDGALGVADDLTGVSQQELAYRGQEDASPRSVEQLDADLRHERGDPLAQGRLHDEEALRGPAEVELLGDHDERAQLLEVHAYLTQVVQPGPRRHRVPG
jgi:hypothetical protein